MPIQSLFPQLFSIGQNTMLSVFVAHPGLTTLSGLGATLSATGSATSYSQSTTNRFTRTPAVEFLVTTAATSAVAGFRHNALFFSRGSTAGNNGFYLRALFKNATGQTIATHRAFVGVRGSAAAPTDANPSSLTNIIGVGWDAGDTNIQMMHNDGTGTATRISLGASFPRPATDRSAVYELEIISPMNQNVVYYRVRDVLSGAIAEGTITTDMPAASQLLTYLGYASVGGTNSVIGIGLSSMLIAYNV